MGRSEKLSQAPVEERLQAAFEAKVEPLALHLFELGEPHWDRFEELLGGMAANGIHFFWGTKRYDQDMEAAGMNAMHRPFGIEMGTLSQNTQIVLYPTTIYKPDSEQREIAKEMGCEIRESGTQVMIYCLDGFEKEAGNIYNLAANLLFISHMSKSALNNYYPLEQGEKSVEFQQQVKTALNVVREYVRKLPGEQGNQLDWHITEIAELTEEEFEKEAGRFALYEAEPIKTHGLLEYDEADIAKETARQSVENSTLLLHLGERNLPQRIKDRHTRDIPAKPWVEYGRNRWNRSNQLFGRYETLLRDGSLRLDFRLDSTHMPALYGFFDTLEITRVSEQTIREHIIFGQEMGEKANLIYLQFFGAKLTPEQLQDSVIPVIVAGDFDFRNSEVRELLGKLAADKGTKPDVGRVVADILRLSSQEKLQRV